jgi:type 1 glutamine amidotransferase
VRAVVFYTGGGGKQAFLATEERRERVQSLLEGGVGIVFLHQAVSCRADHLARVQSWVGGAHLRDVSARGHWRTRHASFPEHPVTRGVTPWAIRDGWLREIAFAEDPAGITPLVWSSRRHRGASAGGSPDVVAWTYEPPRRGRAFCFTGLHAHSAWSLPGLRQLVVNGVLWSAGFEIPLGGAPVSIEGVRIPLSARKPPLAKLLRRFSRRSSARPTGTPL